jgi:integrase
LADIGGKDFETVTDTYIAAKKAGWKNEKHGKQWKATLTAYAFPVFKGTPVGAITVEDVLHCLTPIWEAKPETASRVRGRIENVLDYAKTRGWRTGENPARWKGHLDHLLPARADIARVKHHASLEWSAMPAAMAALTASNTRSAQCLRFIILTAARSGEARAARWNEIDLAKKTWKIPPEKMKAGVEHHVPLSEAAIAVLHAVEPFKKAADGLVFPGGKAGSPLSDVAVSQALASVVAGYTVHGCRGTFRTWAGESTAYPAAVCEAALAHKNENRVEAAYLHTAFFPQRVPLMAEWADYCMSVSTTSL